MKSKLLPSHHYRAKDMHPKNPGNLQPPPCCIYDFPCQSSPPLGGQFKIDIVLFSIIYYRLETDFLALLVKVNY